MCNYLCPIQNFKLDYAFYISNEDAPNNFGRTEFSNRARIK